MLPSPAGFVTLSHCTYCGITGIKVTANAPRSLSRGTVGQLVSNITGTRCLDGDDPQSWLKHWNSKCGKVEANMLTVRASVWRHVIIGKRLKQELDNPRALIPSQGSCMVILKPFFPTSSSIKVVKGFFLFFWGSHTHISSVSLNLIFSRSGCCCFPPGLQEFCPSSHSDV